MRTALKEEAGYGVFARGKRYAEGGRVGTIAVAEEGNMLMLEADVFGSRTYRTSLSFDSSCGKIGNFECTCPYDYGDVCKHVVALGIAYCAQWERNARPAGAVIITPPLADDAIVAMRRKLEAAGIAAASFPDALIIQMVAAEQNAVKKTRVLTPPWKHAGKGWTQITNVSPMTTSAASPPKKPKPCKPLHERYDLKPSTDYRGYLHGVEIQKRENSSWYYRQKIAAHALLQENNLTDAHKTLLALVERHEKDHERNPDIDPTDYTAILVAAREAGMSITCDESYRTPRAFAWRDADLFKKLTWDDVRELLK